MKTIKKPPADQRKTPDNVWKYLSETYEDCEDDSIWKMENFDDEQEEDPFEEEVFESEF